MFKSLRMKMILLFSSIILICGISISLNMYKKSEEIVLTSIGEQAKAITERAVTLLSNEDYANVYREMEETSTYFELREKLNELREANGLKYLYTIRKDEIDETAVYSYVVDGMPLDAVADDVSALGDTIDEPDVGTVSSFENYTTEIGELDYSELYGATITTIMPIYNGQEFLGVVGADFDATVVYSQLKNLKNTILLNLVIMLVIAVVIIVIISSIIVKPIKHIINHLKQIGEGDLTVQVNMTRKDEIGQMSTMFNSMASELKGMIVTVKSNLLHIHQSVTTLSDTLEKSSHLSRQVSEHLDRADAQTEKQYEAISQTTRSLTEVGEGITRVATTAEDMLAVATIARELSHDGNSYMEHLAEQMNSIIVAANKVETDVQQLSNQSQHINEIIDVMKNITSQTGLLALNASIEAARAGEHGRGFNIVAEQIRKLSEQSKASAEQVTELIESVLTTTSRVNDATQLTSQEIAAGAQSVQHASTAFFTINKEVANVTLQANELSATSEQIEATTHVVSSLAEEVTSISGESIEASKTVKNSVTTQINTIANAYDTLAELNQQSEALAQYIKRFKVD